MASEKSPHCSRAFSTPGQTALEAPHLPPSVAPGHPPGARAYPRPTWARPSPLRRLGAPPSTLVEVKGQL